MSCLAVFLLGCLIWVCSFFLRYFSARQSHFSQHIWRVLNILVLGRCWAVLLMPCIHSPFPVGKEKKHLIIYCVPNSLKINVWRHFVSLSIYILNTADNDGKHVSWMFPVHRNLCAYGFKIALTNPSKRSKVIYYYCSL